MTTAAPTIAADVTVTLDDAVARELLSLGGVVEGDLPSWRYPTELKPPTRTPR